MLNDPLVVSLNNKQFTALYNLKILGFRMLLVPMEQDVQMKVESQTLEYYKTPNPSEWEYSQRFVGQINVSKLNN